MAIVLVWRPARVASTPHIHSEGEVKNALRSLDAQAVNRVIADGWDASKTFKAEGSDALSYVIESCEWNPGHDRQKMLMVARALIEAGIPVDRRNAWGDTAYSIAKARRFADQTTPSRR